MINWIFIRVCEGFRTSGYVPDPEESKSGVTIASGVDLGARSIQGLLSLGLPDYIVAQLAPYCGFKRYDAIAKLRNAPLKLSEEECKLLDHCVRRRRLKLLEARWAKAAKQPWSYLSTAQRTVLVSVSFQYGSMPVKCPKFWALVTAGNWKGAISELRNFGDNYRSRRELEADLLEDDLHIT